MEFEKMCMDERSWERYDCGDEGDICVYRRCPECGKWIKEGIIKTNLAGEVKLEGWLCKKHGEVEPFWVRD